MGIGGVEDKPSKRGTYMKVATCEGFIEGGRSSYLTMSSYQKG
jgi:hypothetical protein